LSHLRNGCWLNDEVINFLMNLINERSKRPNQLKCHCFNTFFYAKLTQKNTYQFQNVSRWTKKIDLFSLDKVIIPIHLGSHWTLAVINVRDKRFEYYDSLDGHHEYILKDLKRYLKDEYKDKKKSEIDLSDWEFYIPNRKEIPQQLNGFDCGMFCCTFANFVSQDYDFIFTQSNMKYLRKKALLNILSKSMK
jgi:sentrin-specific protease 1